MAAFIHRTTLEFHTTGSTPNHPVEDWIRNPDLSAVSGVPQKYRKVSGDDVLEMTQAEKDAVDAAELPAYKVAKADAIDARTAELIAIGFTYDTDKQFSLSMPAQANWNGLANMLALNLLVEPDDFPIEANTIDNEDTYLITDIADATAFFSTAAATKKAHLDSGTALKKSVSAAADHAALDAVVDTR